MILATQNGTLYGSPFEQIGLHSENFENARSANFTMAPFVDALLPFEAPPDDPALRTLLASLQVSAAPPALTRATNTRRATHARRGAAPPARRPKRKQAASESR